MAIDKNEIIKLAEKIRHEISEELTVDDVEVYSAFQHSHAVDLIDLIINYLKEFLGVDDDLDQ